MSQSYDNANEEWRPVVGYEGWYEVSSSGRLRRADDGRILLTQRSAGGSQRIVLWKEGRRRAFLIRDLVATAFLGEPPSAGHVVAFVDGDANNPLASNLRYHLPESCGPHDDAREEWRPVVGYEGVYEVSNIGRVKRIDGRQGTRAGKIRSRYFSEAGYYCVVLNWNSRKETFYVHQLVAAAFLGPCPEGMEVNHIDTNKRNNSPDNLEYITHPENMEHAYKNGLIPVGSGRPDAKLNEMLVRVIKLNLKYEKPYTVSRWFGLPTSTVGNIHRGTCWKHVKV